MKLPKIPSKWLIDPNHASIRFYVKHMLISKVDGHFYKFKGSASVSKEDLSDLAVKFEAETSSINTRNEARDEHLRSADFFDVKKYPLISFESTSIRPIGDNFAKMYGYMTLCNTKKLIELDVIFYGTSENDGKTSAGFEIVGAIKRSDFGVGSKFPEAVISDIVQLTIGAEFLLE